ncbi:MAG: hypothetical protein Q6K12_08515, partial [Gloeomargarita sp. DG_1_6_bins_138]
LKQRFINQLFHKFTIGYIMAGGLPPVIFFCLIFSPPDVKVFVKNCTIGCNKMKNFLAPDWVIILLATCSPSRFLGVGHEFEPLSRRFSGN